MSHFRHKTLHSSFDVTLPGFEKVFLVLPKMWRFPWNLVPIWRFRHIVTSFFWVRPGTNLSLKIWPGPGFWVPGFPISAWKDPEVPVDRFQLSGSRTICISFGNRKDENGKTERWRNTYRGVDLKKMTVFSWTNSPTSCTWRKVVDGYNRNIVSLLKHHIRISRVFATLMRPIVRNTGCDSVFLTTSVGATHYFLQHL